MILGEDNRKAWSEMDIVVMQAYQRYKSERCSECGHPVWLCRSSDPRLQVRLNTDGGCYVISEVRAYEQKHAEDEDKLAVRPEIYARDETPLPKFRRPYYENLTASEDEPGESDASD